MSKKNLLEKITFKLKNNKFIAITIVLFIIIISISKLLESILFISEKVSSEKIEYLAPNIEEKEKATEQTKTISSNQRERVKPNKLKDSNHEQIGGNLSDSYKFQILSDTINDLRKIKILCTTCLNTEEIAVDKNGFFILQHTFRRNSQFKIINIIAIYKSNKKLFHLDSRDNSHKPIKF